MGKHLYGRGPGPIGKISVEIKGAQWNARAVELGEEDLGIALERVEMPGQDRLLRHIAAKQPDRLRRLAPNLLQRRVKTGLTPRTFQQDALVHRYQAEPHQLVTEKAARNDNIPCLL